MIARFAGTILGLFAFGLATVAGLVAGNPAEIVLSRALRSLVIFFFIGLVVGAAAQAIVNEHQARRAAELAGDAADTEKLAEGGGAEATPAPAGSGQ